MVMTAPSQVIAGDGVSDGYRKEAEAYGEQDEVEHDLLPGKCSGANFEIGFEP